MSPATSQDVIKTALAPLLRDPSCWTLHFPMYPNTFCLAYHLAVYLHQAGMNREDIDAKFVSDEWWRGHPTFMYRTDIEIFVAIESTISKLERQGHDLRHRFRFTNYLQKYLFARRGRAPLPGQLPLLITDVPLTVEILRDGWKRSAPRWLQAFHAPNAASELKVRKAWTRGIADLSDTQPKIYAFSAPMTQLLFAQSRGPSSKYEAMTSAGGAVPTYYVLRFNSGVPPSKALELMKAISDYYRIVFDSSVNTTVVDDSLADAYARLALTAGQPNPFPEVYPASTLTPQNSLNTGALANRYLEILGRHHKPVTWLP